MARRSDCRKTPELRPFAALLAALIVTTLLTACGGSDSDSSSSTEQATAAGATTTGAAQKNADGEPNDSGDQADHKSQSDSQDQPGNSEPGNSANGGKAQEDVATPLQVSGGGSDQFLTKGGDNSVQEFGAEADESELQEAAETVHDFYVARAEGRWAAACAYLSGSLLEQLEQLAESSPGAQDKGCPPFLESFTSPLSASEWREITTVDAGSLRQEGEQGFLVYYGPGEAVYAMPLAREGDEWKVTALSASALG